MKRTKIIELIGTSATIVALGVLVYFGSGHGSRALFEMYCRTEGFTPVTSLAITAFRWGPFLYGALFLVNIWLSVRSNACHWASWCALSVAGLTTGLVLYGIVRPFAYTTFRMGLP